MAESEEGGSKGDGLRLSAGDGFRGFCETADARPCEDPEVSDPPEVGGPRDGFRHLLRKRLSREGSPGSEVSSLSAHSAPKGFAELCAISNFTFLTGASHAEELVARAAELGLAALAVADVNTLAGVVRAHVAARELNAKAAVAPPPPARRAPPVSNRDVAARWAKADEAEQDEVEAGGGPERPRRKLDNSDRSTVMAEGPSVEEAPGWAGRFLVASRIQLEDSPVAWIILPRDRTAYARLCRLLTLGKRRAEKGVCRLRRSDLLEWVGGEGAEESAGFDLIAVTRDPLASDPQGADVASHLADLARRFPGAVSLAARPAYDGRDAARLSAYAALSAQAGAPMIATADPIMHSAGRRQLADILTCVRTRRTIDTLGALAQPNAERRLRSEAEIRPLFHAFSAAISRTVEIAARCRFSLAELTYEYPDEVAIDPDTGLRMAPQQRLERLVREGLRERYPEGAPERAARQAKHELALIGRLDFARYFLTVRDVVAFARSRGILAQGRGSAANSIVCYALGVTAIGPEIASMVFERFVSEARGEPPDIAVDFEHGRREEVIQHIYERYGRHRAGLCATVIHFRSRAAIREVGRAMGLSVDAVSAIASQLWSWGDADLTEARLREIGLDPSDRRLRQTLRLAGEIIGFPRHLSQHVGGFIMTQGRLDELVPIENAAMEDRTVIEWDKDDIDALGILKVDVLSLGMLTCIRKALDLIADHEGSRYSLASLPPEVPAVYEMLSRGDSVGVFQVESRAQMNFLPRMRPAKFYDLVIEVAIVRPGPIQGDMVHPYLRRRQGKEQVSFPSDELADVLGKTLGVPLFQEQAMQIAIIGAGFSPLEADRLRRALATFRKTGTIHTFRERFVGGMVARGYEPDFAERCFSQIEGFGEYGFPESHAASFALLVYASAWLKRFHPAAFACALLNSQPMGFYAPAQIVRDAREHGVRVRPVSINASFHDCTLEPDGAGGLALRLGFRQIKGVSAEVGARIASARGNGYADLDDLRRRAGIDRAALERFADADAFTDLGLDRRAALWAARAAAAKTLPLFDDTLEGEGLQEPETQLPEMSLGEQVVEDYRALRLSLRAHPLALMRPVLTPGDLGRGDLGRGDLGRGSVGAPPPQPSRARGEGVPFREEAAPYAATDEGAAGQRVGASRLPRPPHSTPAAALVDAPARVRLCMTGLVIIRQRPGSAKGVIFITLEDETGSANIVVWQRVYERFRRAVITGRLLRVTGVIQREGEGDHAVIHLVAERIEDLSSDLDRLAAIDFENAEAHADEVRRPVMSRDPRRGGGPLPKSQPRAMHPRDQARRLFPSRDFH